MKNNGTHRLFLGLLTLGFISSLFVPSFASHGKDNVPSNDEGVFICEDTGKEGPIFYPAEYSSDITNEPSYSTQNGYTFSSMNYNNAHKYYRGESVKVAVIDSGLNYTHEDFRDSNNNQIIQGNSRTIDNSSGSWLYYQFSSGYQSKIVDSLGHGTNVASVIASQINALGCAGIAPNVELYVYKVTNTSNGYEWTAINSALSYCITEGIDVINMSFQAYEHEVTYNSSTMPASTGCSSVMTSYINSCYNAGITLVAAAGNYNTSEPSYPASNNHVISVGSLAESSTTTKAAYSNTYDIDLVAPGTVYVADKGTNSAYKKTQGTSFSAPIVTAAIALYKQQNPTATPAQIESALYASCDSISGNPSWAGNGRLNIDKFLGVDVQDAPAKIVINNPEVVDEELELEIGDYLDLDYTVNGVGTFDHSVNFYTLSGDSNVVSVSSSGRITAVGEGSDYVVIESNADSSVYASVYVTVTSSGATPTVSSVTVTPSSLSLTTGSTGNLSAVVNGDNNPSQVVTWSSSNTSVATVSSTGVVTAKAVGNATITATSELDNTKSDSCTVTVTDSSGATDATQFTLITSTSDLEVGKSYLITSGTSGTIKTMSNSSNNNNRPCVDLTVSSNNKLTRGSNALSVTLGGTSGAYTFKTENYGGTAGYLNATNTTGSNYLKVVSTLDNYAYFNISFSSDAAVITCTGKSSRNIVRYNPNNGSPIITCYTSGQSPVYLWKEVTTKALSSISVNTSPTKITYEAGDYFDPAGLVITRTYTDSTSDTYTYSGHTSEFTFSPTTSTALTTSNTSVTITYGSKSCSQAITVSATKTLSSISISGYTTSFVEGDTFDFGGIVTAHYSDSSSSNVTTSATFTGYNMTTVSNQNVTVSYTYKGVTKTETYGITISKGTLQSISVTEMTTTFLKNHPFSIDGTCTATFANGYQKVVTPTSVTSPDMSTSGNKEITVSFTYNGNTKTTSYNITVNSDRVVIEETTSTSFSLVATVTWPTSSTASISPSGSVNVATDGYTTFESTSLRLGSGSNTGSITVTTTTSKITKVVVSAKSYGSDSSVHLTVGGSDNVITSSYAEYVKEYDVATDSVTIATTASKKRAHVQSIKIYETKTITVETDISNSEDCNGLESFIDTYMHMDYTDNLGYCNDSEHHYYATAKAAFNNLNEHQRSLFTVNSAYLVEWNRLSAWARASGDSLNSSSLLVSGKNMLNIAIENKGSALIMTILGSSTLALAVAYFIFRKKKHER